MAPRRRPIVPGLTAALCAAAALAPASARADFELADGLMPPTCPVLAAFCGDFSVPGFSGWDALDGNTDSAAARARYFRIVRGRGRVPVGRSYFQALVDGAARGGDQPGQRTQVYLSPERDPLRNKTAAYEGSDQWYHSAFAFPRDFRPSPRTEWNWVVQWHNWPDDPCCPNLAMTVDTSRRGTERLSLRVMGGGGPGQGVDTERHAASLRSVRVRWFVGDRRLRRAHWYDSLVHVRWSYRPRHGLVEWWLDGRLVMSARMPTLFWYADNDSEADGATPGPGQAYWMLGYYRPLRSGRRTDGTTARVFHNGARRGPTQASVAF